AGEGLDPRDARHRVLPARALEGSRGGIPDDRRGPEPDRRLRALRARALARAAGPHRRGERALQARELDEAGLRAVLVTDPRPRREDRLDETVAGDAPDLLERGDAREAEPDPVAAQR